MIRPAKARRGQLENGATRMGLRAGRGGRRATRRPRRRRGPGLGLGLGLAGRAVGCGTSMVGSTLV